MKEIKFFLAFGPYWGRHVFKWLSPNNSGRWGNIVSVDEIEEADFVVVAQSTDLNLSHVPPERIVYIQFEPDEFMFVQSMWEGISPLSRMYSLNKHHNLSYMPLGINQTLKTYDEFKKMEFPTKTKDLSWVTSNYGDGSQPLGIQVLQGHRLRMQFLQNFVKKFPDKMDLYGRRLKDKKYDFLCNKGALFDMWDGIENYRYSFAFENSWQKGYFSEKLLTIILAGGVPIYWGCPNLEEFFPEGSFIRLDISREDAPERAMEIVNSDFREKHLDALREAKKLALNKYNIWPSFHRILNEIRRGR